MGKLRTQEDLKKINCPNHIKTKAIRQSINSKDRHAKKKLKKKERLKRRKAGEAPGIPRTLENTRERDETVLDTAETERVEEVQQDVATDEFQNYFEKSYEPKVLITFSDNPLKKTRVFGIELSRIIPNSLVRYRNRASVKKMIESAKQRNFSDIIIVNENMRQPNGLLLIHLPDGPTAHFRLS
ncbi:hypothetical protein LSTR_LSTR002073 [Laodelphax striatellus]|uniref:Brix domain-containing protein n=1 Tax=Laodelphax striatellus TaxID=195883 RepID=A0A482XR38_LAOST|nr:hypothetical protein LSTR_LSTR002073 [Laodelphax striatellus]